MDAIKIYLTVQQFVSVVLIVTTILAYISTVIIDRTRGDINPSSRQTYWLSIIVSAIEYIWPTILLTIYFK